MSQPNKLHKTLKVNQLHDVYKTGRTDYENDSVPEFMNAGKWRDQICAKRDSVFLKKVVFYYHLCIL